MSYVPPHTFSFPSHWLSLPRKEMDRLMQDVTCKHCGIVYSVSKAANGGVPQRGPCRKAPAVSPERLAELQAEAAARRTTTQHRDVQANTRLLALASTPNVAKLI
eukprot:Sspe_Gene.53338::Locus_29506_Transcript_1_1_Confidence_1.000_Length_2233::g.53338::m.53338